MRKRFEKAFDKILLNDKEKNQIIENVISQKSMAKEKTDFWYGKMGGVIIIGAALLVFVLVNAVMLSGMRKGTPASEISGETVVPETLNQLLPADEIAKYTFSVLRNDEGNHAAAEFQAGTVMTCETDKDIENWENFKEKVSSVQITKLAADYQTDAEILCQMVFYNAGGENVSEWNIYNDSLISVDGMFYQISGGELIQFLAENFEQMKVAQNPAILEQEQKIEELKDRIQQEEQNGSSDFPEEQNAVIAELNQELEKTEVIKAEIEELLSGVDGELTQEQQAQIFQKLADYMPVKNASLTGYFGTRWNVKHTGIDMTSDEKTVYLVMDGTVTAYEYMAEKGNCLVIDHGNGVVTEYCHLQESPVSVGDVLSAGTSIGVMGQTGAATGVCLHWEFTVNGEIQNPFVYMANNLEQFKEQPWN